MNKTAIKCLPSKRLRAIWAQVIYLSVGAGPFREIIRGVLAWEREKKRKEKIRKEKTREIIRGVLAWGREKYSKEK